MGFSLEVDMIRHAHELDLLTCPYVFNEEEAVAMTEAGADLIVPHVGVTVAGAVGAQTAMNLGEALRRVEAMMVAAKRIRKDVLILCHGGPIAEPKDVEYILQNGHGIDGFLGGSSMDRLPTERAIRDQVSRFKNLERRS